MENRIKSIGDFAEYHKKWIALVYLVGIFSGLFYLLFK